MKAFLGIDIGSVSTKMALLGAEKRLEKYVYIPTQGQPVKALQSALLQLEDGLPDDFDIIGVCTFFAG